MNSTERAFSEKLKGLIADSTCLVVAFSGGCDSLALLALCSRLPVLKLVPVYVDHNIRSREELDREVSLNLENCRRLGLELVVRTLEPGLVSQIASSRGGGLEDAARFLRYQELEAVRHLVGADWILTAHHLQDRLETILMRLQSGAPFTSLRGIAPVDASRHLVRPLLDFRKEELEAYLVQNGFQWSTDSTNADPGYDRNRIRQLVLPELEKSWPGFQQLLLQLERKASQTYCSACSLTYPETVKNENGSLDLQVFDGLDAGSRMALLYGFWDRTLGQAEGDSGSKDLPMTYVARVLEAISEGKDCTVGSNGTLFTVYHGQLYLSDPSTEAEFSEFEKEIDPFSSKQVILPGNLVLSTGSFADRFLEQKPQLDGSRLLRLDATRFKGRVMVRFVRTGDRIRLKDGTKHVLRLLQDMKVPSHLRCRVPVLVDEDGLCAVFCSVYGGNDRICVKLRSSLAPKQFPLYIVHKG